jgi:signal peptidase II
VVAQGGISAKIRSMRQTLRWVALLAAALATIGCDRATKHVATALLAGEPDRSYLADTVRLGYVENTGGFLSLGAEWPQAARIAVFTVATGLALLALVVVAIRDRFAGPSALGLVLFVTGGSSNWIDRVLHGRVVDFLNLGIGPIRTGVFNVADVAIMAGAGLVALAAIRRDRSMVDERTPPDSMP